MNCITVPVGFWVLVATLEMPVVAFCVIMIVLGVRLVLGQLYGISDNSF